jgi:3-deoxy-D-manno-octulosonate 8-phosphate phosphatase (KDO 8-P phosphatase)
MRYLLLIFCLITCSVKATDTSIQQKSSLIKLIALDVDGVLTNGEITYSSSGEEIKTFNVKDGLGLVLAAQKGFITAVITGRESSMVERRAKELKVTHFYQNIKDKVKVIEDLAAQYNLGLEEICYMGDDLPDLPALNKVGFACCPADAAFQVKEACDWISKNEGGYGAVRELTDLLIQSRFPNLSTP